ncbi:unnamed protein product [Caenorhabditis bovis]|uniref:Uncharacterized protein n=1 Tax=Caenorhabditis bovis TaxID=2654633 RepID=A0A8S1EWN1_9PELO|nr:unnamed protein product [Caenorhabditis bovis]
MEVIYSLPRKTKSSCGAKFQIPTIKVSKVRRSSSLHNVGGEATLQIDETKLSEVSALTPSSSYFSVKSPSPSSYVYTANMARYRCCFGACRLRVGACVIAVSCIIISILSLCSLLSISGQMESEDQTILTPPIVLSLIQFAASMILIVAVLTSCHILILPFVASCILNLLGLIVLCAWAVVRRSSLNPTIVPLVLIFSTGASLIYMWFLTIVSMAFVLIRDRKIMGYDDDFDVENRTFERVSSSIV